MKLAVPDGIDAAPFDLAPRGTPRDRSIGVLCLHGLTGTPYEVRPVAERLADRGMRCRGPVLPGHRECARELAATGFEAWLACSREELAKLRQECDRVFIFGLSMGGVLSLAMSLEGGVDAVAVVGTPIRLPWMIRWGVPVVKGFYPFLPKRGGSSISDDAARERHPGFPVMPLASVHQLVRMQRRVFARLGEISTPLFVGHGALDTTAHPDNAYDIISRVGSGDRELHRYPRSAHIVPVDHEGEILSTRVADFFERLA